MTDPGSDPRTAAAPAPEPQDSVGPDLARAIRAAKTAGTRRRAVVWSWRALIVAVVLGAWQLASTYWLNPFYYSRPSDIWLKLVDWFTEGTSKGSIWLNIGVTIEESVIAFVVGSVVGILLGIALGRSRMAAEVAAPFIQMLNAVPRIILASIFIIWFGLGLSSKVATAFVLVFFPVFFNSFQGAREVDRNLLNNARVLGASRLRIMRSIVVPSATSWILASLHTAFGFALIGAIVGEYAGAEKGLGLLIATAQGTFDTAGIFAGMIVITVLALLAELLLTALEKKLLRWRPSSTAVAVSAI